MPTFNTDQREKKIDYLRSFALFLESAERRPVTIKNYLCDLKYFEKWFEQKTEQKLTPERITPTDLRDYKHFLSEVLSLKPKTVNRKLSSLKSFLNWACSEELIPEHRTPRIPKPIKEEKVGPQWLERNEQHNLVRMVEQGQNQRDITIIQLLLNTGLRVSELCGLMWSDLKITSRKGRLTVRSGKGGKRREIPLNKDARKVLKDLGYSNQKGKFEAIFMGQRGPMTPRGVESMFCKYVAHTELDEVTPHKLRHTFCKNLIDAGVSLSPTEDEIITFFRLSSEDLKLINQCSGDHNQLGFALQLGTLGYLGFVPDELTSAPSSIIEYLAPQIGVSPNCLSLYGKREKTRTNHLLKIQAHLGWRKATRLDFWEWQKWLLDRAMEHDRPILLFRLLCDKLIVSKVVRPGVTILERMVITARSQATKETFNRLQFLLTPSNKAFLDSLLEKDEKTGRTPITWLRHHATTNSPNSILNALEKLTFLEKQNVPSWDLSCLNPNRIKFLAQLGKKSSNQALQRSNDEKRYPILVAFVSQIYSEVTDETMDLYIHCLGDINARAKRDLKEFHLAQTKSTNQKVRLLKELGQVILDQDVKNEQVRTEIFPKISPEALKAAIEDCQRLMRPEDDNHFDFLANRYSYLRRFAPAFFSVFSFSSNLADDPLLETISLLQKLDRENKRKVPDDATQEFIPTKWKNYVFDEKGNIVRRYYEMCLWWELPRALRSGDIWLDNSRRYANPESYLIPPQKWPSLRPEVCQILQLPKNGKERLQPQPEALDYQLEKLHQTINDNDKVRMDENDELIISPLRAEDLPLSAQKLQQLVGKRLPQIDLSELLMEMDKLTGFSYALTHAGGNVSTPEDTRKYLYAAILAQATNLGLSRMATIANLSYDRLVWFTNWYLREDTLKEANNALVNFQYHQWLSQSWGGGTLSSSDGQRFPVAVKNRQAVSLPRYFGYGKGLTFYTWTSDQHSQY